MSEHLPVLCRSFIKNVCPLNISVLSVLINICDLFFFFLVRDLSIHKSPEHLTILSSNRFANTEGFLVTISKSEGKVRII